MIRAFLRKLGLGRPPRGQFEYFANLFCERCARFPVKTGSGVGARIGVLVTPWLSTAAPFLSIECARALAARGAQPVLLWDEANVFANAELASEVARLRDVVDAMRGQLPVLDVATAPPGPPLEQDSLQQLLYENAVRFLGGEANAPAFLAENETFAHAMRAHAERIGALLERERFDWILAPGGFWAASGLWVHMARLQGIPFTTYDGGTRALYVAHDGPAAHFPNVAASFRSISALLSPAERAVLVEEAHVSLRERMAGKDAFRLQPHPSGAPTEKYDLVVPLNYRSDTAALHRQRAFASVTDWLTQILTWAADREGVSVVVRQHPCERIPAYRGTDEWRSVLAPLAARLGPRFRFAAAEDPVNTYDLLAGCRVVLPWTSRTGVESALLGHPVVIGTHCFYSGCGFTADAATPAEYFAAIEKAMAGEAAPSAAAREDAAIVYYIIERCLALTTPFTAQPEDFREWVAQTPEELWGSASGKLLLEALLTREPIGVLQYRCQLRPTP